MKKLFENKNMIYIICEGVALLFGILTFGFLFTPAVFERDKPSLSMFQLATGADVRLEASPLMIFGIILICLSILATVALIVLLIVKKANSLIMTILSVTSIATILIGAAICSCALFITGFNTLNSELGFTQGQWGIEYGNILVPVFALLSIVASYPAALIILHQKDLKDVAKNKPADTIEQE